MHVELEKKLYSVTGELTLKVKIACVPGDIIALYGQSGAGKTSILKMIAGLLVPDQGIIRVNDETWYDASQKIFRKPQRRNIGFVFQDYGLFPNMSVLENINFALAGDSSRDFVGELLHLMELENLKDRKPEILSGGQRQRVAIARALARKPSLLLLDEPFTALDTSLRLRMQELVLKIHERFKLTTIFVSHDLLEVARLTEKVFVLENGAIATFGKPADVVPFQHIQNIIRTLEEKFNYRQL